jgi:hypothetical protein
MAAFDDHVANAKRTLEIAGSAITALDTAGDLATGILGRKPALDDALRVLHVIAAIAHAIREGLAGTIPQQEVDAAIRDLRTGLTSNDQAATMAGDAKFPPG